MLVKVNGEVIEMSYATAMKLAEALGIARSALRRNSIGNGSNVADEYDEMSKAIYEACYEFEAQAYDKAQEAETEDLGISSFSQDEISECNGMTVTRMEWNQFATHRDVMASQLVDGVGHLVLRDGRVCRLYLEPEADPYNWAEEVMR